MGEHQLFTEKKEFKDYFNAPKPKTRQKEKEGQESSYYSCSTFDLKENL